VKTLLNNLRVQFGYEDDGHLVHTDKRTGKQRVTLQTWPAMLSAKTAMSKGLGKIEWEELKEPPPTVGHHRAPCDG
jgi:hypothetical protein